MKFGVIFNLDRNQAVTMLAAGLDLSTEVYSKEGIERAIKIHLSSWGELVWPPYASSTPPPQRRAELIKKADELLTKYWPNYAQEEGVWPHRTEEEEAEWRYKSPDDEEEES